MDFLIELAVTSELEREEECWQWSVTVTLRPGRRRSRAGSGGRAWQQSGAGWGGGTVVICVSRVGCRIGYPYLSGAGWGVAVVYFPRVGGT